MRVLLIMRGIPGSGKSTFIKNNGLEEYALSPDDIRLQFKSKIQTADGGYAISQNNQKRIWSLLFELLENRMKDGCFTVIDATNTRTDELSKYKKLANEYKYRVYCVDFSDIPLEVCKERNINRENFKIVPEYVLDRMYKRITHERIPTGITVIKPDELDKIWFKKRDLSYYKKIVHIGDIHGCYTVLNEYLKDGINPDNFYIFCGDYVDRGIENAKVVNFLLDIMNEKNVLLLEGNHERWLKCYGDFKESFSKEFEKHTRKDLSKANIDRKDIRILYRKLAQCAWYTYNDKEVFVSHGGLAFLPDNVTTVSTDELIYGVGNYDDCEKIANSWADKMPNNIYQVYGHRNTKNLDIKVNDQVFNLEGGVEFGGYLRILELDKDGFNPISIKNDVFRESKPKESLDIDNEVSDLVKEMRNNQYINEKTFDNISSFNFSRKAFQNKIWDQQTMKARGFYIDTNKMKVACRSYDKFFNINENQYSNINTIKETFSFPLKVYEKVNGYLGLIAYDEYHNYQDNLIVTTKSSIRGSHSAIFRNLLNKLIPENKRIELSDYLRDNDVTFVVEVVDMVNDPHIIEYDSNSITLLAIVHNEISFHQEDYSTLKEMATKFGFTAKKFITNLNTPEEFDEFYNKVTTDGYSKPNGEYTEGFVIEDSLDNMVKVKTKYYYFWRKIRSIFEAHLKAIIAQNQNLNLFYFRDIDTTFINGFTRINIYNEVKQVIKDYKYNYIDTRTFPLFIYNILNANITDYIMTSNSFSTINIILLRNTYNIFHESYIKKYHDNKDEVSDNG